MRGLITTAISLVLVLAGCAAQPARTPAPGMPSLRLAPAALDGPLALEQRLVFHHGGRSDTVDALVEADASVLRVVLHRQGQVLMRLGWDGVALQETRGPGLPDALAGQRILDDLQLVHWPHAAIQAALPAGWEVHDAARLRELRHRGETMVTVSWHGGQDASLHNHRDGYRIDITSAPLRP